MAIKSKKIRRTPREKRKLRLRKKVFGSEERPRLCVFKSLKHTYGQVISDENGKTLFSASTRDAEVLEALKGLSSEGAFNDIKSSKSVNAARAVGLVIARKCLEQNRKAVVFDRNGFLYHGRTKAVAEGAREGGLEF
jgi:large subunit ribosomal protein L18